MRRTNNPPSTFVTLVATLLMTLSPSVARGQDDVVIDEKPLRQFSERVAGEIESGKFDLNARFVVELTGTLAKNGRLEPRSVRFLKAESADQRMVEVVKEAIEAVNSAGYFEYVRALEIGTLLLHVEQNETDFVARIESEFANDVRPRSVSTVLNVFVQTKKTQVPSQPNQNDLDDLLLLQRAEATSVGKRLVFSITVPKSELQAMIRRKLTEQKSLKKIQ